MFKAYSIICLLLCLLASQFVECQDTFMEEVLVHRLDAHSTLVTFHFTQETRVWKHHALFPRTISQLVHGSSFRQVELSITQGRWRYQAWGMPLVTPAKPPGAELRLLAVPGLLTRDELAFLTYALAEITCSSLSVLSTLNAWAEQTEHLGDRKARRWLVSYLPQETICGENLTPWLRLLPCGEVQGIAALIANHSLIAHSAYRSLGLTIKHVPGKGIQLAQTLTLVLWDRPRTLPSTSTPPEAQQPMALSRIMGAKSNSACPLASLSHVYVLLERTQREVLRAKKLKPWQRLLSGVEMLKEDELKGESCAWTSGCERRVKTVEEEKTKYALVEYDIKAWNKNATGVRGQSWSDEVRVDRRAPPMHRAPFIVESRITGTGLHHGSLVISLGRSVTPGMGNAASQDVQALGNRGTEPSTSSNGESSDKRKAVVHREPDTLVMTSSKSKLEMNEAKTATQQRRSGEDEEESAQDLTAIERKTTVDGNGRFRAIELSPMATCNVDLPAQTEIAREREKDEHVHGGADSQAASSMSGGGQGQLVCLHQIVPWQVRVWLHTLTLRLDGKVVPLDEVLTWRMIHPAGDRGPPLVLEHCFLWPRSVSSLSISVAFTRAFLSVHESPPDSYRGIDIPPASVTFWRHSSSRRALEGRKGNVHGDKKTEEQDRSECIGTLEGNETAMEEGLRNLEGGGPVLKDGWEDIDRDTEGVGEGERWLEAGHRGSGAADAGLFGGKHDEQSDAKSLDKAKKALNKGKKALEKGDEALEKGNEALGKGKEALDKGKKAVDKGKEALEAVREQEENAGIPLQVVHGNRELQKEDLDRRRQAAERGRGSERGAATTGLALAQLGGRLEWLDCSLDCGSQKEKEEGTGHPAECVCRELACRSPLLEALTSSSQIQMYSQGLLVRIAPPDESMPYNVICMTCTLLAVFVGAGLSALLKRRPGKPVRRNYKRKLMQIAVVLVLFAGLAVVLDDDVHDKAMALWQSLMP